MAEVPPRCRCGVDVHAHVVPENFPRSLKSPAPPERGRCGWQGGGHDRWGDGPPYSAPGSFTVSSSRRMMVSTLVPSASAR